MNGIGERFQQETGYARGRFPQVGMDWAHQPEWLKRYPHAPQLALPVPNLSGERSLWQALLLRRSQRHFGGSVVTAAELSNLLWAAQGVTGGSGEQRLRTAPSAGALYPVETYVALHSVADLPCGLYHYAVGDHLLEQLAAGDQRRAVGRAALDQPVARDADLVLLWSAVFERCRWKYGQRAYRYVYLDAGHIAQNVALAATALGLGSCQIAALYDDEANALLHLDSSEESVIYMTAVGRPPA
jgi:SagB-type dehydrogenase family enzyme